MRFLRNPGVNAVVVCFISALYAAIFIVTSGHLEFERILDHGQTLNSIFWNQWSDFVKEGNLRYLGYAYLIVAVSVLFFSLMRKKNYDEYQAGILTVSLIVTGIVLLLLFPVALLLVLSDSNYAVEMVLFLVVTHWSLFLGADFVCILKWQLE